MLESKWRIGSEAASFLKVSERQLYRWRKAGIFVAGTHYMRKFPNANSALLYQVELCQKAMVDAASRNVETLEIAGSWTIVLELEQRVNQSQQGHNDLAAANLNRKKEIVSLSFNLNDLTDRISTAGL